MTTSTTRAAALCALLATTALATPALAQTNPQPAYRNLDSNGVDLTHGDFVLSFLEGSIGSGEGELALIRQRLGNDPSSWDGIRLDETISYSGDHFLIVNFGPRWEQFVNGVPKQANGAAMSSSGANYIYRAADGTAITFEAVGAAFGNCTPSTSTTCRWIPVSITSPDRKTVTLDWEQWTTCSTTAPDDCTVGSVLLS